VLIFDDPPTRVTIEFGPEAFEHRFSRFFDLEEQRGAVPAREQSDRAKRANASDPLLIYHFTRKRDSYQKRLPPEFAAGRRPDRNVRQACRSVLRGMRCYGELSH
jgi:hypothetical protein